MAEKRTFVYREAAECDLKADVYVPDGPGPHPGVVWIHGGCLITGSREGLRTSQREAYLAAGYVVIAIDYRLAPETKLPAIVEDLEAAFRWAREAGPTLFALAPQRLAAVGHSAGGYLALIAGFRLPVRPSAVVSFYGYGDIIGDWYARPDPFYCAQPTVEEAEARAVVGKGVVSETHDGERYRYYVYLRQHGLWPFGVAGHDPQAERDWLAPFCPVQNVGPGYPPTLLLHGDRDTDVPYAQSVMMAQELSKARVEHDLITIREGEHGFDAGTDAPAHEASARAIVFLGRHV